MRLLTIILVTGSLLNGSVAQADVVWWTEPPLAYDLPIRFIDSVKGTVRKDRVKNWLAVRNRALDFWEIPYEVVTNNSLPPFDGTYGEGVAVTAAIRIGRDVTDACDYYGGWMGTAQGGVAVVCLEPSWWNDSWYKPLAGILGHEIGHAFGLGHTSTGIMGGNWRPNAEELTAVRRYYG